MQPTKFKDINIFGFYDNVVYAYASTEQFLKLKNGNLSSHHVSFGALAIRKQVECHSSLTGNSNTDPFSN